MRVPFDQAVRGGRMAIQVPGSFTCKTCNGTGAAPGTQAQTCAQCHGSGAVQETQGGFAFSRPCPRCYGRGTIITNPCPTCHGAGQTQTRRTYQVKIPKGVRNGQRIRLAGQGEPGRNGGPSGDLYVTINVAPHPKFRRRGNDVTSEVTVNMAQAALGAQVPVETVNGPAKVKVPPGTQSGTKLRLRGRGIQGSDGRKGDHYVVVKVQTPKHLSDEQKDLLRRFAESAGMPTG